MSRAGRILLVIAAVVSLLLLAGATYAAVIVTQTGGLVIDVNESGPEGARVALWLPAGVVELLLPFVPAHVIPEPARKQMDPWLPVALAAWEQLEATPDATFVSVTSAEERVSMRKQGGVLIIEVHDDGQDVLIKLPCRTVTAVLRHLRRAA